MARRMGGLLVGEAGSIVTVVTIDTKGGEESDYFIFLKKEDFPNGPVTTATFVAIGLGDCLGCHGRHGQGGLTLHHTTGKAGGTAAEPLAACRMRDRRRRWCQGRDGNLADWGPPAAASVASACCASSVDRRNIRLGDQHRQGGQP